LHFGRVGSVQSFSLAHPTHDWSWQIGRVPSWHVELSTHATQLWSFPQAGKVLGQSVLPAHWTQRPSLQMGASGALQSDEAWHATHSPEAASQKGFPCSVQSVSTWHRK